MGTPSLLRENLSGLGAKMLIVPVPVLNQRQYEPHSLNIKKTKRSRTTPHAEFLVRRTTRHVSV